MILPSVTVILVSKDSQVLFEQRADNGWWGFPGGAEQRGESLLQAAVREVWEETGIPIEPEHLYLTGIYSDPTLYACSTYADRTVHYCNHTFLYRLPKITLPCCSFESRQLCWLPHAQPPVPFMPAHAFRLHDAMRAHASRWSSPVIR